MHSFGTFMLRRMIISYGRFGTTYLPCNKHVELEGKQQQKFNALAPNDLYIYIYIHIVPHS